MEPFLNVFGVSQVVVENQQKHNDRKLRKQAKAQAKSERKLVAIQKKTKRDIEEKEHLNKIAPLCHTCGNVIEHPNMLVSMPSRTFIFNSNVAFIVLLPGSRWRWLKTQGMVEGYYEYF